MIERGGGRSQSWWELPRFGRQKSFPVGCLHQQGQGIQIPTAVGLEVKKNQDMKLTDAQKTKGGKERRVCHRKMWKRKKEMLNNNQRGACFSTSLELSNFTKREDTRLNCLSRLPRQILLSHTARGVKSKVFPNHHPFYPPHPQERSRLGRAKRKLTHTNLQTGHEIGPWWDRVEKWKGTGR